MTKVTEEIREKHIYTHRYMYMYVLKTSPTFPSPPPSPSHAFVLFSKRVFNFCN